MAEKNSRKSRHQPPPSSLIIYKTPRSRSITNELEKEPILQPIRVRERKVSVRTNTDCTPTSEKNHKVADLIEQFEKSKSTDDVQLSVKSKSVSSLLNYHPSEPIYSNNSRTPLFKQNKITTKGSLQSVPKSKQFPSLTKLTIETSIHDISKDQTTYDTLRPNNLYNSHDVISTTTSLDSMTALTPGPLLRRGEFIKSQSNDIINSASVISSISSNVNLSRDGPYDVSSIDEDKDFGVNLKTNIFKRIEEVYTTEVTYVKTLYVLSSKLPAQIKETCEKDENLIKRFNKIYKSLLETLHRLYKFHYGIILPHIEEYKTGHREDNMWSILQEHFQTIEDLYKAYYVAYAESQRKLEHLCKSHSLIHRAMLKCQVHLGNLYPVAELNCANQRLLRYILLMKSHMKHLDENSAEYEHTRFIHDELGRIAERCEEQLAVSPSQLKKLKVRLDNKLECFHNQQLIWHGSLKKQSPRKRTDIVQLYIILFSECILVCDESGNKLEIKRQLSIKNITVDIIEERRLAPTTVNSANGQQLGTVIYYPFRLNAVEKSYEFLVDKESDREKWVNKIKQACEDFKSQTSTIGIHQSSHHSDEQQFGIRAPVWVNDIDVTRCQICNNRFGSKLMSSRRHHCRSCGRCICNGCSGKKLILKYCNKEGEVRVCDTCYTQATGINRNPISSTKITRDPDKTILFGDFRCMPTNSIIWIDLQEDYQLHIYGAKLDQVEDLSINLTELRQISFIEETRTFILNGKDKTYKFSIELNHQISFQKNDYIDENAKNVNNKSLFYANVWHDTMQLARSKTLPLWYVRKRNSADSGISTL